MKQAVRQAARKLGRLLNQDAKEALSRVEFALREAAEGSARLNRDATRALARIEGTVREGGISRTSIAARYVHGEGLEIGALNRPLPVPADAHVRYVDAVSEATLRQRFPDVALVTPPDIVDDGETLATVAHSSQDFVIANHFLEHTEDPFRTLKNFVRVLRPGGAIFMAIPDKRWTFDLPRPITPLAHLLRDFREGPAVSRADHYDEWLRIIDGHSGELLAQRKEAFIRDRVNIHFHVWTIDEMAEMFIAAKRELGMQVEVALCYADPPMQEVVWVLQAG